MISAVRRCTAVSLTGVTGKHVPVTTLTVREPGQGPDLAPTLLPFAMEILVLGVPLTWEPATISAVSWYYFFSRPMPSCTEGAKRH